MTEAAFHFRSRISASLLFTTSQLQAMIIRRRYACGSLQTYLVSSINRRSYASQRPRIQIPPPFPIVESCPSPTCACRPMPSGLDLDLERPLGGTMAAYAEQVLISTGRNDWSSRIEDEDSLAKELKVLRGRGGKFTDPFYNVMITNSSFSSDATSASASAYLLPSFRYIPNIPLDPESVERFLKAFVLPTELHSVHDALSEEQKDTLRRDPSLQSGFADVRDVNEILVLICGHGGRDERCGILGPILQEEFKDQFRRHGFHVTESISAPHITPAERKGDTPDVRVGMISHIGGHKYAGNVIIYIPPSFKENALAGKGLWYGRVNPQNVEGIIKSSILDGKVIRDMFRGGIGKGRDILRL